MKRTRKWLLCPLIIVALLLCAIPAYADIPTLPHAFYGTLTIEGSAAPIGTVVTAEVDEVECGSITTTVAGQYGGSGAFDPKLTVSGEIETGATIKFYVNDLYTGVGYDSAFSPGGVTEHNLVIGDTTPPSVTLTPLSPDPTNDTTPTFTGTATDGLSNISSVEYQVGTGAWRVWTAASAVDGAFDEPSEEYTFTIPALAEGGYIVYVRATDAASNTTAEENYATDAFTIDTTAPTVSSTSPANGATGVPLTAVVTATFSEAMDASTITTSSFTLKVGATPVSGTVSYNSGTYTATFDPSANLTDGATYTVTLTTAITDVAGNSLAAEYSWSFDTGEDTTAPTVTINPLIPDPTSDSTPTFTGTATDTASNISSVEYRIGTGSWVAATASDGAFDSPSEGYTFTTTTLADGGYTVYVRATDAAANTTAEVDYATDSFTVDATPPTVSSTSPADGATGIGIATVVTATFSEAMDDSTITTSSFTLDSVSGTVSYDSGTYTATFTPDADLEYETTYTATLSTAITDLAGNPLASPYTWSFTTRTSECIPGDANEDGEVDILDVTKTERIIVGLDAETCGADANEDGEVDILDVTKIERIIAGLD